LWEQYDKANKTSSELQADANEMIDVMCALKVKEQLSLLQTFAGQNIINPNNAAERMHLFKDVILKMTGNCLFFN